MDRFPPPAPLPPSGETPRRAEGRPTTLALPARPTAVPRVAAGLIAAAALAAAALACSGSPFAPPTPTPTATATQTPSPTPTRTPTPTPTATAAPAVYTEDLADGSKRLVDTEAGYAFTVPDRWLVVVLSGEDSADIMGAIAQQYPDFAPLIESSASSGMRVMGMDLDPAHMEGGEGPVLNVALEENMPDIPLELFLSLYVGMVPDIIPGAKVTGSDLIETSGGIPVGIVDVEMTVRDPQGVEQKIRMRQAVFSAEGGLIDLNLGAPASRFDELEPTFARIIDSLELLPPG